MSNRHALERARERYGISLDPRDLARLHAAIRQRDQRTARFVCAQSFSHREAWLVRVRRVWMLAVWDRAKSVIVTFLPPHIQFNEHGQEMTE